MTVSDQMRNANTIPGAAVSCDRNSPYDGVGTGSAKGAPTTDATERRGGLL
jgi:hypothetical protein